MYYIRDMYFDSQPPCSFGLSATSQQYFSLRTKRPAVLFSQNKPASSTFLSEQINTSHQPSAKRTGWKSNDILPPFQIVGHYDFSRFIMVKSFSLGI
jgi:hypothetical protein